MVCTFSLSCRDTLASDIALHHPVHRKLLRDYDHGEEARSLTDARQWAQRSVHQEIFVKTCVFTVPHCKNKLIIVIAQVPGIYVAINSWHPVLQLLYPT